METSWNTKLEIALELLAAVIAKTIKDGKTTEDKDLKELLEEREKMYLGDKVVIDNIIEKYSIKNV